MKLAHLCALGGAMMWAGAPLTANAAVTLQSVYVDSYSDASVGALTDSLEKDHTFFKLKPSYNRSTSASEVLGRDSAHAAARTHADFASASSGTYSITASASADAPKTNDAEGFSGGTFAYDFDLSSPEDLTLDWDVSGRSSATGDAWATPGDFFIALHRIGSQGDLYSDWLYVGDVGSALLKNLSPGAYELITYVYDEADACVTGVGRASASLAGDFGFNFTATPEPSAWALMILGLGLTGAAVRRQRRAASATA